MATDSQAALSEAIMQGSRALADYAINFTGAILIFIVGFMLAGILSRWVRRTLNNVSRLDQTISGFLANLVKYAVWILVLVTVLAQFGVQTTSIIAAIGAAGLAIGLALQGTLANIAAGIMLLVLRPFRVGEYIIAGSIAGTVQEIGLFTTELKQPDGLFVMAPNNQLWNTSIVNYSRHKTRRFELVIGIGYDDDVELAKNTMLDLAKADGRVLSDPQPKAFVQMLGDSAINIGMWAWINTDEYIDTSRDLTEHARSRFAEVGLSIPYPHREVIQRIVSEAKSD